MNYDDCILRLSVGIALNSRHNDATRKPRATSQTFLINVNCINKVTYQYIPR